MLIFAVQKNKNFWEKQQVKLGSISSYWNQFSCEVFSFELQTLLNLLSKFAMKTMAFNFFPEVTIGFSRKN